MMQQVWAEHALIDGKWQQNVKLELADGRITSLTPGSGAKGHCVGLLVPAPSNGHSHAFQRAMAGLTEKRDPASQDSFWTWRHLMFRFLEHLTPETVEAIAAYVQMEMLEAGFGASVEFHYLHHQADGTAYDAVAEMSERIMAAAQCSGIGLTLLPVLYQYGGCDRRALAPGQVRFGNTLDSFADLLAEAERCMALLPDDACLGTAPHSLRAVGQESLRDIQSLRPDAPIHMHLAEQLAEVEEVQSVWGARPVEWALDNLDLSQRWSLIHCTQMQPDETERLAHTGVVAGLCPLTEANLGDGIFDGVRWVQNAGAFAIGSDSNIRISLAEELRQLDTSQRLRDHIRAAFATGKRSSGRRLMEDAAKGGAQAAGRGHGTISIGAWGDLLALDMDHPDLAGLAPDTALDSFVFAGNTAMVRDVWSAGRHMVQDGRHIARDDITRRYRAAVRSLRDGI